jgi:release factor glutamine methyltransferase
VLTRDELAARLRAAGCVYAEDEADVILATAASPDEVDLMLGRRVAGEPLEQVVGWAELCGVRVGIDPGVFVPRQRSGLLVREAVRAARAVPGRRPVVVDLCCGSGALGLAVAGQVPCQLHAADIDPAAVACARGNLQPSDGPVRGHVHQGDLFDALPTTLRGRIDVLVVNAPYVPTDEIALMPAEAREHEARLALDGGGDGVEVHRRVAAGAARWLADGGVLLVETSERQEPLTAAAVRAGGLVATTVLDDDLGACVVVGHRPSGSA